MDDGTTTVLDTQWLTRVGTACAIAYYEREWTNIALQMEAIQQATNDMKQLLTDQTDYWGKLEIQLVRMRDYSNLTMVSRQKPVEAMITAIKGHEWVEPPTDEDPAGTAEFLVELGSPRLITREEFEDGWQRAEAGY